jgi:hypothetical protein
VDLRVRVFYYGNEFVPRVQKVVDDLQIDLTKKRVRGLLITSFE